MALSLYSKISEILANPAAVEALNKINPAITGHPMLGMAMDMTVSQCAMYAPEVLTAEVLEKVKEALAGLEG